MAQKLVHQSNRVILIILSLLLVTGLLLVVTGPTQAYASPIISIVSINKDVSVTIAGTNFPIGQTFTVRMGAYGTLGIGGTIVGSYDSSLGGYFTATYAIPAGLVGSDSIAIRLESPEGFYAFNWFYNDGSASATAVPGPFYPAGYYGYPTFEISSVSAGSSVTVWTHNFPAGQIFTVRMGEYGTLAIGGTVVGSTVDTGGSYSATFAIPAWLAGRSQIAIRMEGPTGLYAYNWFYNNTASGIPPAITPIPGVPPVPGYVGIPSFWISAVVRDSTVTIQGYNFPSGQTFNVLMGPFGTMGIGGIPVSAMDSGSGGSFSATYNVPAALAGSPKIAIRLETSDGYFYAYNWFYNNTTY